MDQNEKLNRFGVTHVLATMLNCTHLWSSCLGSASPKEDWKFRICGNYKYKVTISQALAVEEYHLNSCSQPCLEAALSEGKVFSKMDLSQAYLQLAVDEDSKPYLTINTHKGLYAYNWLPLLVACAFSKKGWTHFCKGFLEWPATSMSF